MDKKHTLEIFAINKSVKGHMSVYVCVYITYSIVATQQEENPI